MLSISGEKLVALPLIGWKNVTLGHSKSELALNNTAFIINSDMQSRSRQELQDLVREQLQLLLEQKNFQGAKALLVPVQVADIAESIEGLPEPTQAIAFRLLSKEEAIEVFEYLDPSVQQTLL